MTKEQFIEASEALQSANLGWIQRIRSQVRSTSSLVPPAIVFIKKPPSDEVREILLQDPDLYCTPDDYEQRYSLPIPGYYISQSTLVRLVELGFLTAEQISRMTRRKSDVTMVDTVMF